MRDRLVALGLALTALSLTMVTMSDVGLTTDEPHFNFPNSLRQVEWFKLIASKIVEGDWSYPFTREVIAAHWGGNYHPTFARTLSGISWLMFHELLGDIVAFRLSSSFMFALTVGLLYLFISRAYSWKEGLFAAIAYLTMPRAFGHAHIAALDTAITCMWFATTYAFWRGMTQPKWALVTGVLYGLALATKIHALFIPIPLFLWGIMIYGKRQWVPNLLAMVTLAPVVGVLIQPWLWTSLFSQVSTKVVSYNQRPTIPVYYFGTTFNFAPPWHYSFVLAVVTVPPAIVVSYLMGLLQMRRKNSVALLLAFNALTALSLLLIPTAPGYHGVRLFLPAFPFLAGLAGIGFGQSLDYVARWQFWHGGTRRGVTRALCVWGLSGFFLGSSIYSLVDSRPYYLSYFNAFVGGVKGAHALGMETTYWGDTINQEVLNFLNTHIEKHASLFFIYSWTGEYYRKANLLHREIKYPPTAADYWVLTPYQGIFDDYVWAVYREIPPFHAFKFKGIPMVLVYKRDDVLQRFWFLANHNRYNKITE